jgi:ethanolamine ammonia-lyase large subunit
VAVRFTVYKSTECKDNQGYAGVNQVSDVPYLIKSPKGNDIMVSYKTVAYAKVTFAWFEKAVGYITIGSNLTPRQVGFVY